MVAIHPTFQQTLILFLRCNSHYSLLGLFSMYPFPFNWFSIHACMYNAHSSCSACNWSRLLVLTTTPSGVDTHEAHPYTLPALTEAYMRMLVRAGARACNTKGNWHGGTWRKWTHHPEPLTSCIIHKPRMKPDQRETAPTWAHFQQQATHACMTVNAPGPEIQTVVAYLLRDQRQGRGVCTHDDHVPRDNESR